MVTHPFLAALAWYMFFACMVYLLAVVVIFVLLLAVAIRENRLRARETRLEDFSTLLGSPFTIPVSVVAPAYNEEVCVTAAVRSLLALQYPEYEVIVVNDGSKDQTLARLHEDYGSKRPTRSTEGRCRAWTSGRSIAAGPIPGCSSSTRRMAARPMR